MANGRTNSRLMLSKPSSTKKRRHRIPVIREYLHICMQNIPYGSTDMNILLTANRRTRIVIIVQTQGSCNISLKLIVEKIKTNRDNKDKYKNGGFSEYRTRELCKINPLEIERIYEIGKLIEPVYMDKQEGERER